MSSIAISGLNQLNTITTDDFFPLVDSGSLTTFRASFATLNSWSLASGSASSSLQTISASFSKTSSFASRAITSSFAITSSKSFLADTASYFNFITNIPPFAVSSLSASWATTSFQATSASFAITSSFSQRSRTSDTSSFLLYSGFPNGTASNALNAGSSTSASFATTASYANRSSTSDTASSVSGNSPGSIKAWATCVYTASVPNNSVLVSPGVNWNVPSLANSYNVSSIVRTMGTPPKRTDPHGDVFDTYKGDSDYPGMHWLVTLTTPLPSTNYIVNAGTGGGTDIAWSIYTVFPLAARTTTQFTLSRAAGSEGFSGGHDISWFSFQVLSNP